MVLGWDEATNGICEICWLFQLALVAMNQNVGSSTLVSMDWRHTSVQVVKFTLEAETCHSALLLPLLVVL